MKFYLETTEFSDGGANGVYLLDDAKEKMYAYVSPGSKTVKTFKNPIRIVTKGRSFKVVNNTYGYKIPNEVAENTRWEVTGSKGDKYFVTQTNSGLTCSCSGFKFRAECKHVKQFGDGVGQTKSNNMAKGSMDQDRSPLVKTVSQISRRRTG